MCMCVCVCVSHRYVIKWDVSKGDLGPPLQRIPMLRPDQVCVCVCVCVRVCVCV